MKEELKASVLAGFRLNYKQRRAVEARGRDVVVTAGAGSGKTSTLVGRYLHLLADGIEPRHIAAITFTKKAALEMQSRVRTKLEELKGKADTPEELQFWADLAGKMDGARIGTIHSLCAEILRNHPAEAGVDPRFDMLDESLASHYKNEAVQDCLAWMVTREEMLPLLRQIKLLSLERILADLLDDRLKARVFFDKEIDFAPAYCAEIRKRIRAVGLDEVMDTIGGMSPLALEEDCGNLAAPLREVWQGWQALQATLQSDDALAIAQGLFDFRVNFPTARTGKRDSEVKKEFFAMRDRFDENLAILFKTKDEIRPEQSVEENHERLLPLLKQAFMVLDQAYQTRKDADQALDFDDLEHYTQKLLRDPAIRERWQSELEAVLVDEYQDTNRRQREIVNALAGKNGKLFIVGDMRQSIYRFRGADVTVFREEQERIRREGGELIELNLTYRSHEPLLDGMGVLLSEVIGTEGDPNRPHFVPFTAMKAHREHAPEHLPNAPIEFMLGAAENMDEARGQLADVLAARLLGLKDQGVIRSWDEVAILCRASTSFPYYESALDSAGIPFSTVAGKGFYERAEIRDLLNILRFLAYPADQTALVGLLRSPAFGLSDTSLLRLHKAYDGFEGLLEKEADFLGEKQAEKFRRVVRFTEEFLPLVDRVHVGELLSKIIDWCDYRAILSLASEDEAGGRSDLRLWRNLDKLLDEAIHSDLVSVREFLKRLDTLSDAGAREGEAVSDAQGAVSIMTIHKSKGLEFPVVVLGDCGRRENFRSQGVFINPEMGIALKQEQPSLAYLAAKTLEQEEEESESSRLLYVAMTRAKDLLILNGHVTLGKTPSSTGWCGELIDAAGLDLAEVIENGDQLLQSQPLPGLNVSIWCPASVQRWRQDQLDQQSPEEEMHQPPLFNEVRQTKSKAEEEPDEEAEEELIKVSESQARARILGSIVHKMLQRWNFPGDEQFEPMLNGLLNGFRVADPSSREYFREQTRAKLEAFAKHPLFADINAAEERYAELPYTYWKRHWHVHRVIDLLFCKDGQWQLVDFKTDLIESEEDRRRLVETYRRQLTDYKTAMEKELGHRVSAKICFLSDRGQISISEL